MTSSTLSVFLRTYTPQTNKPATQCHFKIFFTKFLLASERYCVSVILTPILQILQKQKTFNKDWNRNKLAIYQTNSTSDDTYISHIAQLNIILKSRMNRGSANVIEAQKSLLNFHLLMSRLYILNAPSSRRGFDCLMRFVSLQI